MMVLSHSPNATADNLILNPYFFERYNGTHFDFDNNKIAFSGSHAYFEPKKEDPSGGKGSTIAIIIIAVVLGVCLIGAGVWWFMRRKSLESKLTRYD